MRGSATRSAPDDGHDYEVEVWNPLVPALGVLAFGLIQLGLGLAGLVLLPWLAWKDREAKRRCAHG